MQHRQSNAHWTSEIAFQELSKEEKKSAGLLYDIHPFIWYWMQDNLPTDKVVTGMTFYWRILDGVSKEQGSLKRKPQKKKSDYTQNYEETAEISWEYNERGWIEKLNTHRAYWGQER